MLRRTRFVMLKRPFWVVFDGERLVEHMAAGKVARWTLEPGLALRFPFVWQARAVAATLPTAKVYRIVRSEPFDDDPVALFI
jgi:hypothetical protein